MNHPSGMLAGRRYDPVKRGIDVLAAAAGLVLTAPVQVIVAVLVARRMGRPVMFAQQRPGRGGIPFRLVKFRTMHSPQPAIGLLTDAERLTAFGSWLRSTSLDELPTLWNVLRGEMSLVGPRPLLMGYLDRYTPAQARRHEVRPGVTGLAQVTGRNTLAWDAKLAADVEYVDHRSLGLDVRILLCTVHSVIRRDGISADGNVTVEEFTGSPVRDGQP